MNTLSATSLLEQFTLAQLNNRDDVVIIDVREPDEYAHEHISGAVNVPLSQFKQANFEKDQHKIAIFHCRSGNRTQINESLLNNTPFKQKFCIGGGIAQWKAANLPVISKMSAPIDVMRQVQLIISLMILVGLALGLSLSPYFFLITAFAGVGLMIASLTGFCGLAELLKFLPWNKAKPS